MTRDQADEISMIMRRADDMYERLAAGDSSTYLRARIATVDALLLTLQGVPDALLNANDYGVWGCEATRRHSAP